MARYFHHKIPPDKTLHGANQRVLAKRLLQEALRLLEKEETSPIQTAIHAIVEDIATALTGREIQFLDTVESNYPNGIKKGLNECINEIVLYDGLPPMLTTEEYDKGIMVDYEYFSQAYRDFKA